ncbi:MAG: hypothetical protein V4671_15050 [Armatimonadota bacterium]
MRTRVTARDSKIVCLSRASCLLAMAGFVMVGSCFTSGCNKNAGSGSGGLSKSDSERLHAPLGQPMPPEAREAMAKAMSKRGGAPTSAAPTAPAPPGPK